MRIVLSCDILVLSCDDRVCLVIAFNLVWPGLKKVLCVGLSCRVFCCVMCCVVLCCVVRCVVWCLVFCGDVLCCVVLCCVVCCLVFGKRKPVECIELVVQMPSKMESKRKDIETKPKTTKQQKTKTKTTTSPYYNITRQPQDHHHKAIPRQDKTRKWGIITSSFPIV